MQNAGYSIGSTLSNKKAFNELFLTIAKHSQTIN